MRMIKKGVILVAGAGTRLLPVTEDISKCMLPLGGRPILQHSLECMESLGITEICIVVRPEFRQHIEGRFGHTFGASSLTYIEQDVKRKGTAAAVISAGDFIGADDVLIMAGDIISECSDVKRLVEFHNRHNGGATMLLKEVADPRRFGIAVLDGDRVVDIVEKPDNPKSNLANASVYAVGKRFIDEARNVEISPRGEYEITSALYPLSTEGRLYGVVAHGYWNDIGTPWDLLDANEYVMKGLKSDVKGRVEGCTITGTIVVEEGAEVFNSYIEGPCYIARGAKVGPFAHVRKYSYIGPSCEVGGFTVVKNSILMDGVKAKHLSYIGDSIVGHDTNFGSSTQIANLRFDRQTVKMRVNGTLQDSGRKKMGCVVGPHVNFGVNSTVLPGKKIGSSSIVGSGVIVSDDVPANTRVVCKQNLEHTPINK